MDFRQLKYFEAIFEHGTLTGAAENVRVAPSALSHHLSNLEIELGVSLFRRKPRGMEPTAAGRRLHEHSKLILRAVESAHADLQAAGEKTSGNVSVGMAYSAVKAIGVELAQRMIEDLPRVNFALSESLSGATLQHLMRSEVDLALVYNAPSNSQLQVTPVLEERMVLVGRREIIGESSDPISFNELLDLPIILLRQGLSARAIIDDANLLKKLETRAKLQMNSVQAIAGSLEAGLGCVIGTTLFMRDQIASGALHFRPIVEPELSRTLYLCELTNRPSTYALEAVRGVVLELVSGAVQNNDWEATLVE